MTGSQGRSSMHQTFCAPLVSRVRLAEEVFASFSPTKLKFEPPEGFRHLNPSVIRISGRFSAVQRTVRYGQASVVTRNFWLDFDDNFLIQKVREILPDDTYLARSRNDCLGLEDIRPFQWGNEIWGISSAREFNSKGWWSEIVLNQFWLNDSDHVYIRKPYVVHPDFGVSRNEKNWMVQLSENCPTFIYSVSPLIVVDHFGKIIKKLEQDIPVDTIRGGTQMIPFCNGWLSFVHQVFFENGERFYGHRAFYISSDYSKIRLSELFFFLKPSVEFAAGIASLGDKEKIYVSFGADDRESWIATIDHSDIIDILFD